MSVQREIFRDLDLFHLVFFLGSPSSVLLIRNLLKNLSYLYLEIKKNKFTKIKTVLQHPPIEVAGDLFCEAQEMFYGL